MKNFFYKQRESIVVALFLGIAGALVYFAVLPLLKGIVAVKNEIQASNIKRDIKKQQLAELPNMRQQDSKIASQAGQMDILLNKDKAVILIEHLEKLSQETNNEISISIVDTSSEAQLKQKTTSKGDQSAGVRLEDALPSKDYLKLKISLGGDYAGLFKFMHNLETLEYYCDVVSIASGRSSDGIAPVAKIPANGGNIANPFAASSAVEGALSEADRNKLSTSLEVVFYTKK